MAVRFPRRALLVSGAAAAAVGWTELIWPRLTAGFGPALEFEPIRNAQGYRRLVIAGRRNGGTIDPFAGLAAPETETQDPLPAARLPRDPCHALYGDPPSGRVALAVFTDFNCPYCRVLDQKLFDLAESRPDELSLQVHQLPLLGTSSLWAARGALAAGQQDAYLAFHKRLMGAAFAIGPDYLGGVAKDLGLDEEKFMQDAIGKTVEDQIAWSRGFAARLGIIGTPGLLVGRSLVLGLVSDAVLGNLIRLEASETEAPNCAVFA